MPSHTARGSLTIVPGMSVVFDGVRCVRCNIVAEASKENCVLHEGDQTPPGLSFLSKPVPDLVCDDVAYWRLYVS